MPCTFIDPALPLLRQRAPKPGVRKREVFGWAM